MVVIHPDAANEIRAAAFAYEDVAHDLVRPFLDDIERAIARAKAGCLPKAYGIPDGMCTTMLERFSYRLYFYERDERLYLVACRRIPRLLRATAASLAS